MAEVSNRKTQLIIYSFFVMLCFCTLPAQAQYGGGKGEPNDPYLIYTPEQMKEIGSNPSDWHKHFKLMVDINLSNYTGTDFNIIGDSDTPFTGVFDGNSHTISHFKYISTNKGCIGLFGIIDDPNAQIRDLGLVNPEIDAGTGDQVGSLVGRIANGTITDCYVEGSSVFGEFIVGGLVGFNGGKITNCHSISNVSGKGEVGGLVANSSGTITNCYATGEVSGEHEVGGLVGINWGIISNCSSTGSITGNDYVGGLVGQNSNWYSSGEGRITDCYATGTVIGTTNVGGLVGQNGLSFEDGFGWILISGTISNSCSTGSISGNEVVGGLVGLNNVGTIANCYATSSSSAEHSVGGLVGKNWDRITNCYSVGSVVGTSDVGGLVGLNEIEGSVTSSFWDTKNSMLSTSASGTGKTTVEMQTASIFLNAGWDFVGEIENGTEDIWWILEGQDYPRLIWELPEGIELGPLPAFSPYPRDGAVDVPQTLTLCWLPGGAGLYHDIYFGEDEEAVTKATTGSQGIYRGRQEPEITTFYLDTLKLEKTYYWRIDEVNEADPNGFPKGNVWNFTTANFIIVDDFESYDAGDNQIWYSWNDGLGYGPPGAWDVGNHTGSAVGDETTPSYTEETIVHGGMQSMPYRYNNNKQGYAYYSEAEKWLSYPRDWTKEGVSELSLWFHGRQAPVGSFVEGPAGIYTMTGSGTDIGGEHDQFHFAYKSLTGPGSIVARIESIENTHEWAKAGVMIRQGLSEISKYAFVYVTPSNGIAFQARAECRQASVAMNQTGITAPLWLKLERDEVGNFAASYSMDGTTWQPVQNAVPMNISMSSKVYIGLALTAHNSDATSQAVFSNITITGTINEQWEHQDIGIVNNDPEPMYVAVSNRTGMPAVIYHDDPNAVRIDTWTEWIIPLQTLADQGIDLTDVDRIAIGIGTGGNRTIPGGQGKMYFDDVRLYQSRQAVLNDLEVNIP